MLPTIAASPSSIGATVFLTSDGAVWPYAEGQTDYSFDLFIAKQRSGKSALLGRKVLGPVVATGNSQLPMVAFLDIGYGSAGIIDLLRNTLPPDKRYLVEHRKVQADGKFVVNPFDIPLGCRRPPASLRSLIVQAI